VHPKPSDTVEVDYSGWTLDGSLFDSSISRGETISFPLNGVIAGWTEGVQVCGSLSLCVRVSEGCVGV
jgi:FKBP-type peptidyl-prolyl cis-trans isomerase